jgi:hypothetical protein
MFERHIEGVEIDDLIKGLPTTWPTRRVTDGVFPFVRPTVRTAAVDRAGNLWVSLAVPFTYVYGPDGDKIRTVIQPVPAPWRPRAFLCGSRITTPGLSSSTRDPVISARGLSRRFGPRRRRRRHWKCKVVIIALLGPNGAGGRRPCGCWLV